MTKHIQTRESIRAAGPCYTDEKIDRLVPPEGNTPRQVAELPISDEDRLWGLIYSCGAAQKDLVEFACKCARRVRQGAPGTKALETAEAWLRGEATAENCRKAANAYIARAAYAAASAYAASAAYAAYASAYASAYAANAAAANAAAADERKWQINTLVSMLEADE